MSTLTQVEQSSPATPSASNQVLYPKAGTYCRMASDGIERQIMTQPGLGSPSVLLFIYNNYGGF